MSLVSVQPFGLEAPGGGARILRALYRDPPTRVVSIVTGRVPPPPAQEWEEVHLPLRPSLGPLDGSRYDHWGHGVEIALAGGARRRLTELFATYDAEMVHAVAHWGSFWPALGAARALGVPYVLSVHDDLRYLLRGAPLSAVAEARMRRVWLAADHRFVISTALGEEYSARYGGAAYQIVTDGLADDDFVTRRTARAPGPRCYFAGLFHRGYHGNVVTFLEALSQLRARDGGLRPSLTCRCGALPALPPTSVPVSVLPFGSEQAVRDDLESADLLYLPLMFEPAYRGMTAFSLSTKLVTYLGSGLPIVYHGPADTAAGQLLAEHDAAILATSTDPDRVARAIAEGLPRASEIVANAQALGRREFRLEDQRERFWSAAYPRSAALV